MWICYDMNLQFYSVAVYTSRSFYFVTDGLTVCTLIYLLLLGVRIFNSLFAKITYVVSRVY
jgi:hypothetical protein